MKLKSFHIINFGGLHDYDYEFEEGLNVILHDNGWGKTTMAAFLKAMLYGFDTKRSKDITENERRRYLPWQGGEYGGSLDFEADGVNYRIHRTFGETPRFDKTRIVNLDTHTTAKINPDKIGETLFKLDANAFQRSIFITQNGLGIDGAASSIHTRLNTLVSQANDVGAFDDAVSRLNQEIKVYEKTGNRGKIGDITKLIAEKERQKDRMESSIKEQSEARKRIVEIDQSLSFIDESLKKKKAKLEELSGDLKKKETAKKLIDEIDGNIRETKAQIDQILSDFGGHLPTNLEVDRVKQQNRRIRELSREINNLRKDIVSLQEKHDDISAMYQDELPSVRMIDEIQRTYGELQGILSTGKEISDKTHPQEYTLISSAVKENPEYIDQLKETIALQDSISSTVHRLDSKNNEIRNENRSWEEKKKQYTSLRANTDAQQERLEEIKKYSPDQLDPVLRELERQGKEERELSQKLITETRHLASESINWVAKRKKYQSLKDESDYAEKALLKFERYSEDQISPVIEQLAELQTKEQVVSLKQEQLNTQRLSKEDLTLLDQYPDAKNTYAEGNNVLQIYRDLTAKNAELTGLQNILAGENSKAESYRASLAQYTVLPGNDTVVTEPKKPSGSLLIAIGAVLTISGLALAFMMSMAMMAIAALGVVLIVLGVMNNSKYNTELQKYQEYLSLSKQREEAIKKRDEINTQLADSVAKSDELKSWINTAESDIAADEKKVDEWLSKYKQSANNPESEIRFVMDQAEKAQKVSEQKENNDILQKEIATNSSEFVKAFDQVKANYKELDNKNIAEAINLLRANATEYKVRKEKAQNASANLNRFFKENSITTEQINGENSPSLPLIQKQIDEIKDSQLRLKEERIPCDVAYPEIADLSYEEAVDALKQKRADYIVVKSEYTTAVKNEGSFLRSSGIEKDQLAMEQSPKAAELKLQKKTLAELLKNTISAGNTVVKNIGLSFDETNALDVLRKAESILRVYDEENRKISESSTRNQKKQKQIAALQNTLEKQSYALKGAYIDMELPERLGLIREDVLEEANLRRQIIAKNSALTEKQRQCETARKAVQTFENTYIHFEPQTENAIEEVDEKLASSTALSAALFQAEAQKKSVIEQNQINTENQNGEAEQTLRLEIRTEERRRDALRDEYTQKTDLIRQADQAATLYPDVVTEIHELYEQKQKAQNRVSMLKRTVQLITKAKENLADRYLSKVEQLFNNYMHIWLDNDAVRGILDIDFKVKIEEDDKIHSAEGYSTGYCDLIDFCMRLALVDTLFEKEQPFLVLDDPFVNLDSSRLDKALELINIMAINKQIIYFVCHPIRAVETDINDTTRKEYVKLAESTKKMLESRKTTPSAQKKAVYKSPKERYQIDTGKTCYIELVKPGRTITNSIFGLDFQVKEGFTKDATYELFFVDEKGHVLNERQILEVNDGELSNNRIQFSLNTRDDSGKEYELMIRESGQDNYDIVARIPFAAKLAFTGTFAFDF